jgi:hypothetical protein
MTTYYSDNDIALAALDTSQDPPDRVWIRVDPQGRTIGFALTYDYDSTAIAMGDVCGPMFGITFDELLRSGLCNAVRRCDSCLGIFRAQDLRGGRCCKCNQPHEVWYLTPDGPRCRKEGIAQ